MPNNSGRPRPLLLNAYASADALPVTPHPSYSRYNGTVVRGKPARWIHFDPRPCLIPPDWSAGYSSIFALQAKEQDIAKYSEIDNEKKRIYAAMVDSMDQAIGKILEAVDTRGIAENTFVLFFSDNGGISYGDNRPWRGGKGTVYEGGVRVPAVLRWPAGVAGGRSVDAMMGYIDVYPTIKRVAGITDPDPNPLDGRDMLDVIRGERKAPKRDWFSYIAQGRPDRTAVCDGTWKLVVLGGSVLDVTLERAIRGGDSRAKPSVELFHLKRDPGEQTNLAADHPDIVAGLLERLKAFRRLKISGVPDFREGREGFKAPRDWVITE